MRTVASATLVALLCVASTSVASATWFNKTAFSTLVNATLAAKDAKAQPTVVSKVQSKLAAKESSIDLVATYLTGNRTLTFDPKNATSLQGFLDYTRGRLAFEARLKTGAAFTTAAVAASTASATANDIVCYVDPQAGTVLNIIQGGQGSCTAGGVAVTVPTAGKYVTRFEMAVDKEVPLVGRFNFFVQDTLDAKPRLYTCGYAGGEAISLFPKGYVLMSLPIGCQPLTPADLGRRRRLAAAPPPKLAINPQLVDPVVASVAEVAAAVAAGTVSGGAVSPAVQATGVVQSPTFANAVGSTSTEIAALLDVANASPSPLEVVPTPTMTAPDAQAARSSVPTPGLMSNASSYDSPPARTPFSNDTDTG